GPSCATTAAARPWSTTRGRASPSPSTATRGPAPESGATRCTAGRHRVIWSATVRPLISWELLRGVGMRRLKWLLLLGGLAVLAGPAAPGLRAGDDKPAKVADKEAPAFTRTRDVIYGRKAGLALTMDVFLPKNEAKGLGVIFVVSGGWFSRPEAIRPE